MSSTCPETFVASSERRSGNYRTLWRWHFYAGLFVMPFLVILAVTGTLYCFQPQIEPLLYPHLLHVTPASSPLLSQETLLGRARAAVPASAKVTTVRVSNQADGSAEFVFRLKSGESRSAYVNPYLGNVLGTLSVEHRFMQVDRMIHRSLLLGKFGELLMELVGCWTLVMIGTGIALWWPRGNTPLWRSLVPRLTLKGRQAWRSLHTVIGVWIACGAVAFVATGLPWTGSWGKHFKSLATSTNLGAPFGAWGELRLVSGGTQSGAKKSKQESKVSEHDMPGMPGMPGLTMDDMPAPTNVPWAVGSLVVPHTSVGNHVPLSIDQIMTIVKNQGINGGYDLSVPRTADGVFTVTYVPADPRNERTLYIDQYNGDVIKDFRYEDYGVLAKGVSFGTSLHMGHYFGSLNQILCGVVSLGLAGLSITGCVMWWRRRPKGLTVGAPTRDLQSPQMRGWKVGMLLLGAFFPLMGATMLAVWLLDRVLFQPHAVAHQ